MKDITSEELAVLRSSESYYLVWYSAYWCGPCQRMDKAALDAAAAEIGVPFYYADCGKHEDLINESITSFPTFVLYLGPLAVATRNTSDTTKVCQWMKKLVT
jgi:thiol-disulfide isomerase/thioredoxin